MAGRPVIADWRKRSWAGHYDHADFNQESCWTPKPGDVAGPRIVVGYVIDGVEKKLKLRRWLFNVVQVEGKTHEPLAWEDIVVPDSSCVATCVNPWHQRVVDRITAGRLRGAMYKDAYSAEAAARAAAETGTRRADFDTQRETAHRAALDRWFGLYCVQRLFGMMGGGKWDLDRRYDSDALDDDLQNMYEERFGADHDKMVAWRSEQRAAGRDLLEINRQQVDVWLSKPGHEPIKDAMDEHDVWPLSDELLKRGAYASLLDDDETAWA